MAIVERLEQAGEMRGGSQDHQYVEDLMRVAP